MKQLNISLSGASPILYHLTNQTSALAILKDNEFHLAPATGTAADNKLNKGKMYFLSTARSKTGKYNTLRHGMVQFVLDGIKIGQNFKASAVDYWGEQYRGFDGGKYEMEDRILSDKPTMPSLKYIKEVHFQALGDKSSRNPEPQVDKRDKLRFRQLIIFCKLKKIPLFIYASSADAKLMNKAKAISPKELNLKRDTIERAWVERKRPRASTSGYGLMELIHQRKYTQLTKKGLYWLDYLKPYRESDFVTQVGNEIHNNKRDQSHTIHKVLTWMRENKIADVQALFDYLQPRWSKSLGLTR